jgi:hypothetical protein
LVGVPASKPMRNCSSSSALQGLPVLGGNSARLRRAGAATGVPAPASRACDTANSARMTGGALYGLSSGMTSPVTGWMPCASVSRMARAVCNSMVDPFVEVNWMDIQSFHNAAQPGPLTA